MSGGGVAAVVFPGQVSLTRGGGSFSESQLGQRPGSYLRESGHRLLFYDRRMSDEGLRQARDKMAAAGVDPVAIEVFAHYYRLVESGETGMVPESTIEPLDSAALADADVPDALAKQAIGRTAVIKLNGGLGTSMGMDRAKSLLEVRDGLSFLDIIVRQVLALREEYDAPLPLVFMNSFRTSADTREVLARYPDLAVGRAAAGVPAEQGAQAP